MQSNWCLKVLRSNVLRSKVHIGLESLPHPEARKKLNCDSIPQLPATILMENTDEQRRLAQIVSFHEKICTVYVIFLECNSVN